jgi:hypothetical protein
MNEREGSVMGKISADFLMGRASIEVIDPDKNLETVRKHLRTGSGIVLFNHFKGDFFLWARFVKENLAPLDNVTAMVAMKYLDPHRGLTSKTLSFMFPKWEKSHGVKVLPVVQSKENGIYLEHKRINIASTLKARGFLRIPGHILAFSPEGTRSLSGVLGAAEEGVDLIIRASKNSIVIPVAAEDSSGSGVRLYKSTTRIRVGTPFFNQDVERDHEDHPDIKRKDLIMQRLAQLLPEQKRGLNK